MDVGSVYGSSALQSTQQSTDNSTDVVKQGENSLADVAQRLVCELGDLQQANPQITNPNDLKVGQEINVPPKPTPAPASNGSTTGPQLVAGGTSQAPVGDPLVANAMKAKVDGMGWQGLADWGNPGVSGPPDQAEDNRAMSRLGMSPDELRDLAERDQALRQHGMSLDAPKISLGDIGNKTPEMKGGLKVDGPTPFEFAAVAQLGLAAAAKAAVTTPLAAVSGALGVVGAFKLGTDIRNALDAPGKERDSGITQMQSDMNSVAHDLIRQKFPDIPELNGRGKQLAEQALSNWKDKKGDELNDTLKQFQAVRSIPPALITDDNRAKKLNELNDKLKGQLNQGTVDLGNTLMNVYYDPRNWKEGTTANKP